MIEPMKALVKDRNEVMDVLGINYTEKTISLWNGKFRFVRSFDEVKPIRPTGFHDINGDSSRMLWEGDVLIDEDGVYMVITWRKEFGGWWMKDNYGPGFHKLLAFVLRDGAKYAGNIWTTPELVPWYEEDETK